MTPLASAGTFSPPTFPAKPQRHWVISLPVLSFCPSPRKGSDPLPNQHAPFSWGLLLVREWQVTWVCPIRMKETSYSLCGSRFFLLSKEDKGERAAQRRGPPAAGMSAARRRLKPKLTSRQAGSRQAGRPGFLVELRSRSRCWSPGPLESGYVNGRKRSLFGDASCCQSQAALEPAAGLTPLPVALSGSRGTQGGGPSTCPVFLPARLSPPTSVRLLECGSQR